MKSVGNVYTSKQMKAVAQSIICFTVTYIHLTITTEILGEFASLTNKNIKPSSKHHSLDANIEDAYMFIPATGTQTHTQNPQAAHQ